MRYQHTPDAGDAYFAYDSKGQLKLSENAQQRLDNKYSTTSYDYLGRPTVVMQTSHNGTNTATPASILPDLSGNGPTLLSMNREILDNPNFVNNLTLFNFEQITQTSYNDITSPYSLFSNGENQRGRVALSLYLKDAGVLSSIDNQTFSCYDYDVHGNVKMLTTKRIQDFPKKTEYEYGLLSGKVNKVSYQKGYVDQFYHLYKYDADNRIRNVYTSNNDEIWQEDAEYFYYPHGPLSRVELGKEKIQGVDYFYSLQGWLKGINTPNSDGDDIGKDGGISSGNLNLHFQKDQMAYAIGYYQGDYQPITPSLTNFGSGSNTSTWNSFGPYIKQGSAPPAKLGLFNGNISWTVSDIPKLSDPAIGFDRTNAMVYQYDQLNRLVVSRSNTNFNKITGIWGARMTPTLGMKWDENFAYDANGNIKHLERIGQTNGTKIDDLTYNYSISNTNKLTSVDDLGSNDGLPSGQSSNNYSYDEIGNLKLDVSEDIDDIKWNVYGKIESITYKKTISPPKNDLAFEYDPTGNRVAKIVKKGALQKDWEYITYSRDASGNIMANYSTTYIPNSSDPHKFTAKTYLQEFPLYGSSRLGTRSSSNMLVSEEEFTISGYETDGSFTDKSSVSGGSYTVNPTQQIYTSALGLKQFELTNHLGNVLATVSDNTKRFQLTTGNQNLAMFETEVTSAQDYYPFGMLMPGRIYSSLNGYRFGYQGFEKDDDIAGSGNHLAFGDYGYDPRLGKRWTVDKHSAKYPFISPYTSFNDNPLIYSDPTGKDVILMVWATGNGQYGHAAIAVSNYKIVGYTQDNYMGQVVNIPIIEKDGTYTYYDLWPGKDIDGDGKSDQIGEAGPTDAFTGPVAHYQVFKNLTENDLVNGDPSRAEGRAPDGVIKLNSGLDEDMETVADLESHMGSNGSYTSVNNNCSDFAATGVGEALDKYKWVIESSADESAYVLNFTTPNSLFKYVQEKVKNNPSEGSILKDPGNVVDTKFKDAVITPAKEAQKQKK